VPPGSFIGPDGKLMESAQIGISTVPVSLIQGMLPPGMTGVKVAMTLQAPAVTKFTAPLQATFANIYDAAPGTQLNVLSYDHAMGMITVAGTATVSADGKTVTTDPGSGIPFLGWFYVAPPGSQGNGPGSGPCSGGGSNNDVQREQLQNDQIKNGFDLVSVLSNLYSTIPGTPSAFGPLFNTLTNSWSLAFDSDRLLEDINNVPAGQPRTGID
jgi:hypothetical protein